jgi:hypothetical protein
MEWMFFAIVWLALGLPTLLAYLVLMRHALRSGSTGWAVFMLLAPFLGGLIYYFSQYRPALEARRLAYAMEPDPALPPLS